MKITNTLLLILLITTLLNCHKQLNKPVVDKEIKPSNKIQVLNFGTFHFGYTSDANSVNFDEENKELQKEVRKIAKMIAKFKPTIICVESLPKYHDEINIAYQYFLASPSKLNTNYGEVSMLAFDVARLCNIKKIYGIDNSMEYNYMIGNSIETNPKLKNSIDPVTYTEYFKHPFKDYSDLEKQYENYDKLSLLDKLKFTNKPKVLDFSITINADNLLYVGVDNGFEGANEAAKFYHRNMKIYSNLNRIKMNKNDRIFILMGGAHTAFLREFIKRSPKFEMVNTFDFLN